MARALPEHGRIVDLGCGWGLLSLSLCAGSPDRRVTAVDHDPERVRVAKRAAQRVPSTARPVFVCADVATYLATIPDRSIDGIAMIDMLHYFDPAIQLSLIIHAARSLKPGGVLLARDIDADAGLRSRINRLYERVATGIGFTKSATVRLAFRGRLEWANLLESAGFEVQSSRSGLPMLADILFLARKE